MTFATITINYKCEDCSDIGAIVSDTGTNVEVQRCDHCAVYDSDLEPQKYFQKKWCETREWFYPEVKTGVHLTKYPGSNKWQLKKEEA